MQDSQRSGVLAKAPAMEIFSRRRRIIDSPQQSNMYGIMPCMCCIFFFKKMGQFRPLFIYFHYFLDTISIIEKKRRCSAWDSNPEPQDGRRIRNHGAMAATTFWGFLHSEHNSFLLGPIQPSSPTTKELLHQHQAVSGYHSH